jgi:hypothetical protein
MTPLIVLAVAIVMTAAYLVTLGRMVLTNRPAPLPRSHEYELDPHTQRLRG